ncbi:hypothetical protein NIIDMKKI_50110 [Mycobacterium kansasii]|uniref:Uncharacterized protein n=1 Tax=Mycobacterium kansasii TaxID=1768 RepID=A0A7G1IJC1_MYCKA|nr:hypothetical protein NIIDMKKI_50110 [Mycobacterium kansasii]
MRVVGDKRLRLGGVEFQQRHRALPGQRGHQAGPSGGDPQALRRRQRTGDHRGGHLTHRVAYHQIGLHPVGAPQRGQRQLHTDQPQLDLLDADELLAFGDHLV